MPAAKYLRPSFVGVLLILIFVGLSAPPALAASATTATSLAITAAGAETSAVAPGQVVTLTATTTAGTVAVQSGQVNFCDAAAPSCTDIHMLGKAQLTSAGTAALNFVPAPGSHSYKAVFAGTSSDAASTSSASPLTVSAATTTTIAQSGSAGAYTLTATVAGEGLSAAPTGTVSFLDTTNANAVLGTALLGAGTAAQAWTTPTAPATEPAQQSIAVADFNGDGIADIAVGTNSNASTNGKGYLGILLGNGDGTFKAVNNFVALANNQAIAVAPFVTGGPEDILSVSNSASASNNAVLLIGDGKGGGTAGAPFSLSFTSVAGVATGDFNGDGNQDFIVTGATPEVSNVFAAAVFLGNGNGTFGTPTIFPVGSAPLSIAVGDFNGDGKLDFAMADSGASTVAVFLGDGAGDFTPAAGGTTGTDPVALVAGDFNGDGKLDLAVANNGDNTVSILLGNGDGSFATTSSPATGGNPTSLAVSDFNADGIQDLAVANNGDNTVTILLGKGDGAFTASASQTTGAGPQGIAVGNFNGNGNADLAVANAGTANDVAGAATVLLSQFTETATATVSGIAPTGAGTHLVDASYPGDDDYAASVSGTTSLTGVGGITATPNSLTFASQLAGTTSAAQIVTLTNTGTAAVAITSIAATAPFAETNTCGSSVAAGAQCAVSVTFAPAAAGSATGTLTIAAGDAAPTLVALSGTATSPNPTVTISPASLTFDALDTGSASTAQAVTLTNSGTVAVSITSIAASGDFAETNTCGTTLAAAASCTISVTFTPTVAGARTGTLTVTDNATGGSQTVALAGTGSSVGVSATTSSLTIGSAGGSATDTIQISSAQGFAGTVNLTCAVTYKGSGAAKDPPTCALSPATGNVSANASLSSTLTVSTTGSGATSSLNGSGANEGWLHSGEALAALLFLGFLPRRRWKGTTLLILLALTAAFAAVGCGGGSKAANQSTTTGSYQVVVTATSSTVTASTTIALTLQ